MKKTMLRRGSRGIRGTLQNAQHHAPKLTPMVKSLYRDRDTYGFTEWGEAHNVHKAWTEDGRTFSFRPIVGDNGEGYIGLRLYLEKSRTDRTIIASCFYDCRNHVSIDLFKVILRACAEKPTGTNYLESTKVSE